MKDVLSVIGFAVCFLSVIFMVLGLSGTIHAATFPVETLKEMQEKYCNFTIEGK
jgi:hypothetical protein